MTSIHYLSDPEEYEEKGDGFNQTGRHRSDHKIVSSCINKTKAHFYSICESEYFLFIMQLIGRHSKNARFPCGIDSKHLTLSNTCFMRGVLSSVAVV